MDRATNSTAPADRLFCAVELSKNSWLLGIQFPDREKASIYPLEGGDSEGLMAKLVAACDRWTKLSGKKPGAQDVSGASTADARIASALGGQPPLHPSSQLSTPQVWSTCPAWPSRNPGRCTVGRSSASAHHAGARRPSPCTAGTRHSSDQRVDAGDCL